MSLPHPHCREQGHKAHFWYLICPLMSPQVLSGLCLFPDLESCWEHSSTWDKGELQTKDPPQRVPSVCCGLGGGAGVFVISMG